VGDVLAALAVVLLVARLVVDEDISIEFS